MHWISKTSTRRSFPSRRPVLAVVMALGCLSLLPAATAGAVDDVATSSGASLKGTCVAAGTATPKILYDGTSVNHPGDRKTQTFTAEADYKPLPEGCEGVFRRTPFIQFQVQSPTSHSRWSDAGPFLTPKKSETARKAELEQLEEEREEQGESCWVPIPGGEKNTCRTDPLVAGEGGVGGVYFHPQWKLHEPSYSRHDPRLYRCTPGNGITHVRALFKSTVTSVVTREIVEQRVAIVPVRVTHYPGKGPMPKAWRGAVRGSC